MLYTIQTHCGAMSNTGTLFNVNDCVRNICEYLRPFHSIEEVTRNMSGADDVLRTHIRSVLREFDLKQYEDEANELFPILNKVSTLWEKISPVANQKIPTEKYVKHLVYHGLANPCVLDIYYHKTHFIRPQCDDITWKS